MKKQKQEKKAIKTDEVIKTKTVDNIIVYF